MNTSASSIFDIMNIFRAYGREREGLYGMYYMLYCLHKGYRVYFAYDNNRTVTDLNIISEDNRHINDNIMREFSVQGIRGLFIGLPENSIYKLFEVLSAIDLNNCYVEIIDNLVETFALSASKALGEFAIPNNLVNLLTNILCTLSVKKVYNPYSGSGAIVSNIKGVSVEGEEPFIHSALISKILLEAHGNNPDSIIIGNPLMHPFSHGFDSFISVPPFMMRISENEPYLSDIDHKTRTVEDVLLWRFLNNDSYRTGIIIVPAGICFDKTHSEIRAALVNRGCLDTVVSLPNGLFYATGINTLLLVLNKDKVEPSIRFIDGTKCSLKIEKRNCLDNEAIFRKYVGEDNRTTYMATVEEMEERDYSLMPTMYDLGQGLIIPEGYKDFRFNEVFQIARMSLCSPYEKGYILKPSDFSRNLLEILDYRKEESSGASSTYRKSLEPVTLALSFLGEEMKIVKLDGKSTVFANSNQIPLCFIPSSPIDFDYAIISLLKNENFNKLADNYKGMQLRRARDLSKYLDTITLIAPESKEEQRKLFNEKLNSLKAEKAQALKDELTRLGTRETVSDLSHMMNTPFSNIGDLLGVLPDEEMSENARKWIVQLRDNFEYLKRLIKTVGADFSIDTCPMEDIEILSFMSEYIQSWSNINHQFFKTELLSNLSFDNLSIRGNATLLRIALDCIFKNAQRHGFRNRYSEENKVSIVLAEVNHMDKPFVCISIANNGEPFPNSFTVNDFIKRGKVAGVSGKTGLGGYHIYSIIKRLGGFLNITNDGNGDVIFELLIPAPGISLKTLNPYNNAENCL